MEKGSGREGNRDSPGQSVAKRGTVGSWSINENQHTAWSVLEALQEQDTNFHASSPTGIHLGP